MVWWWIVAVDQEHGRGTAWREVALTAGALWVVLGLGCFGVGVETVAARWGTSLDGALALDLWFLVGALLLIGVVAWRMRSRGVTLHDLGWRRPAPVAVWVVAVVYGLLWTAMSYAGGADPLAWSWQRPVMVLVGPVLAFAEELAVRGYLIEMLRRAGTATWLQVLGSAVVMGSYHGLIGWHYSVTYGVASSVLFGVLSALYVWGRRSLMPVLVAHAMTHVLGDPELIRGILVGLEAMR